MDFQQQIITTLAETYGFDPIEAMGKIKTMIDEQERPVIKKKIPLPHCGVVVDDWCMGIRNNHGLLTQCTKSKHGDGKYCSTCQGQADKNEGALKYGDVSVESHLKATHYTNVMKKMEISREEAEQAAAAPQ